MLLIFLVPVMLFRDSEERTVIGWFYNQRHTFYDDIAEAPKMQAVALMW